MAPLTHSPWVPTKLLTPSPIPVGILHSQSCVRLVVDTTPPVITLIGDDSITHPASSTYIDQGAHWSDIIDGQGKATASGFVDINKPGSYEISYSAVDQSGNYADPIYRIVNVVDQDPPILTLLGDANITHEAGSEYLDAGTSWYDNIDGNGTADSNGSVDPFTKHLQITYSFTDSSGNTAQSVVRTVTVVDTTPPVITLVGDENMTINIGTPFVEPGAFSNDLVDGESQTKTKLDQSARGILIILSRIGCSRKYR